ncbi:MAG: ABC transporter ATP-binding protein [Pseudomonadota bacterium]
MKAVVLNQVGKEFRYYRRDLDRLAEVLTGRPRHTAVTALQGVSVAIDRGEVVGIVGRNGAGKSTLLKLVAGVMPPSTGQVFVGGRVSALLELGSGFHPDLTGRDNLRLAAALADQDRADAERLIDWVRAFGELDQALDRPVRTYSSGMFARLAFAAATFQAPDILIVDEALSVGDGAFARRSFDRIMEFRRTGSTILFCSHSQYQVEAICSRVLWLENGTLQADGEAAGVLARYAASLQQPATRVAAPQHPMPASAPPQGSARLEGAKVWIDQQTGHHLKAYCGKSSLRVEVRWHSDPSLPIPSVAVGILGRDGHFVTSAGTHNDGIMLTQDPVGTGQVSIEFPELPLLKGHYEVAVYLLCEKGIHIYDQALQVAEIEVRQTGLEQGVVSLPHHWEIR